MVTLKGKELRDYLRLLTDDGDEMLKRSRIQPFVGEPKSYEEIRAWGRREDERRD